MMDERTVVPLPATADSAAGSVPDPAVSLHVVRGVPTAEELAALITVLLAEETGPSDPSRPARSAWSDPARLLPRSPAGASLDRAPGAWRRSFGPV